MEEKMYFLNSGTITIREINLLIIISSAVLVRVDCSSISWSKRRFVRNRLNPELKEKIAEITNVTAILIRLLSKKICITNEVAMD
jgi:hypothetical protein